MFTVLAASPLLLTIALLLLTKKGWVAPLIGLTAAILLALTAFGTTGTELAGAVATNGPTIIEVLAIIAGGVALSRVMDATGAQAILAKWLSVNTGTTLTTTFLMTHGAMPFIESATGFGVSILIGIPLLINLGFTPMRAALLSVLGLVVSAWGSMAPGTLLGAELTGFSLMDLGIATALVNWIAPIISGILIPFVALSANSATIRLKQITVGVTMGVTLSGFVLVSNLLLGTAVAGAFGALLNMLLLLGLVRIRRRRRPQSVPGVGRSFTPYAVLLSGLIVSQLLLSDVLPVLGSPAIWLLVASAVALTILHRHMTLSARVLAGNAAMLWVAVGVPTGLYMLLGTVFASGGMAKELAAFLASQGTWFLVLSPFLGGAGGYITASTTGANAMFATTQAAGAQALGVNTLHIVGTHNAASSLWALASPARIETAYQVASTHGEVNRTRLAGIAVGYVFVVTIGWAVMNLLVL